MMIRLTGNLMMTQVRPGLGWPDHELLVVGAADRPPAAPTTSNSDSPGCQTS